MILNISEAAKRVSVSRSTLYKMKKLGAISFSILESGYPGIDESELARVFPKQFKIQDKVQSNTSLETQENISSTVERLQHIIDQQKDRELTLLKERCERAERQVDNLMKITQSQTTQLLAPPSKQSFLRGLFYKRE